MSVRRLAKERRLPRLHRRVARKGPLGIAKFPPGPSNRPAPLLWLARSRRLGQRTGRPRRRRDAGHAVIRVLENVTFYTMFHLAPVGGVAVVSVCGTPPCMLRGSEDLEAYLEGGSGRASISRPMADSPGKRSSAWAPAPNAPLVSINDRYYEDLDPESLARIIDEFDAGRPPPRVRR